MEKTYKLLSRGMPYSTSVIVKEVQPYAVYIEISQDAKYINGGECAFHYRLLSNPDDNLARWIHDPLEYISNAALTAGTAQLKRNQKEVRKLTRQGKSHPAFVEMSKVVKRVVKHYKDDFRIHDSLSLGLLSPESPFIWVANVNGTHLYHVKSHALTGLEFYTALNNIGGHDYHFYFWNGSTLKEIYPELSFHKKPVASNLTLYPYVKRLAENIK